MAGRAGETSQPGQGDRGVTIDLVTEKAAFAVEFIDLPRAAQADGATWESFQLAYLNNSGRFGIDIKSRQIAWSFTSALDAIVDGTLTPHTPHVFVSINLEEAKEKIRYAKLIHEAIDAPMRLRIRRESGTELELSPSRRSP